MGGVLVMTQTIGCIGGGSSEEKDGKLSDSEIVDKFNDFLPMFPSDDLTFLYDKEGGTSSTEVNIINETEAESSSEVEDSEPTDKGTWVISSYLYTEKEKQGVVLRFNKNTREATGNFILEKEEKESEYPIYYDKGKMHLIDEDTSIEVKEKLEDFKMMYEFIELDRAYLDSLESTKIMYNPNVPLYDAKYKLDIKDKNIAKIKELYPELIVEDNNCILTLEGSGTAWKKTGYLNLRIRLDEKYNTYFTSSMSFQNSEDSDVVEESDE